MFNSTVNWIKTMGGPLVGMPPESVLFWGGDAFNSDRPSATLYASDYVRACSTKKYLECLPAGESVLVFGDMPLETTAIPEKKVIARVFYADANTDFNEIFNAADFDGLSSPLEDIEIELGLSGLVIFDSAAVGEFVGESLKFNIAPGRYCVKTYIFNPDDRTSLLIHRFEPEMYVN